MTNFARNPNSASARVAGLLILPLLAALSGCSPDETSVISIPRSDAEALARQEKSEFKLRGCVKINGKVPFGRGYLVAYRAGLPQQAVASAKFHLDGGFSMDNVPLGELTLVLRRRIETATNPALESARDGPPIPGDMGRKNKNYVPGRVENMPPGGDLEGKNKRNSTAFLTQAPKKELLDALKFDSLPAGDLPPEAEWLFDQSFNKFGNPTKSSALKITIEEDNEKNILVRDLKVQ